MPVAVQELPRRRPCRQRNQRIASLPSKNCRWGCLVIVLRCRQRFSCT
jgi:hypothetical protein